MSGGGRGNRGGGLGQLSPSTGRVGGGDGDPDRGRGRRGRGREQPSPSTGRVGRFDGNPDRGRGRRGRGRGQPSPSTGRVRGGDRGGRGPGPERGRRGYPSPSTGRVGRGQSHGDREHPPPYYRTYRWSEWRAISSQSVLPEPSKAMRPGVGTAGKGMIVKANHFLVDVANRDLCHYDVSITPEVSSKKLCRDIVNQLVKPHHFSDLGKRMLAFDGRKNAYAAGPLPFPSKCIDVILTDKDNSSRRDRKYNVTLKFAAQTDIHHVQQLLQERLLDASYETIQALDLVLREKPSNSYKVVGRSFFSHPQRFGQVNFNELGGGLEYWEGFYQSLRLTQMACLSTLVSEYVAKHFNQDLMQPFSDQDWIKVKRVLRNIAVWVLYPKHGKQYKVSSISTEPTENLMFQLAESGQRISVAQYFKKKYNIVLKHPLLPAIQAGSDTKPVYLPMELCHIVEGQRHSKKLNEKQVTGLLRANCLRPPELKKYIKEEVYKNYNGDVLMNEFGIRVKAKLTSVKARVLPAPTLKYHNKTGKESRIDPSVGEWNMIDKKMIEGGKVDFWTAINYSQLLTTDLDNFCNKLLGICCSKGMQFCERPLVPTRSAHPDQITKSLKDIQTQSTACLTGRKGKHLQLLIVILPEVSGAYGEIKRVCETELGIVSQCCQPKHVLKYSMQYMENVALKINVKVGGRNSALEQAVPYLTDPTDTSTMIFGADVTHPQPGEGSAPSIAAVVGSMDWPEVTKFRASVSSQPYREEIIQDLYKIISDPEKGDSHGGMIRELLLEFNLSTKLKPGRIIFYRHGVSEGQFNQVRLHEVRAIRQACLSMEEYYEPKITFVVVRKRHHTRLFPANHGDRDSTDKSGNILPGTVVDTEICHPSEFDFYLCSHAGIQGTSRPAHYHVLYDENNFTADALQGLTNNLCYTYARCTRSVSIVPPAYYARLAAFRARYCIGGETTEGGSPTGGAPNTTQERSSEVRPLPDIKDNVKKVMFYC